MKIKLNQIKINLKILKISRLLKCLNFKNLKSKKCKKSLQICNFQIFSFSKIHLDKK